MAEINVQKVNNNDSGFQSRKKLNENDALLAKLVSQKADKSDIENLIGGMINKGSVNTITDLPSTAEKGWSYVVVNERNPDNGLSYIYQYDGTGWNNTGLTAFPADVVVQSDLEKTVNHFGKNGIIKELYVKNELDKDISANFIGSYYIYNIGKSSDGSTGNIYFAKYYSATNEVKTALFSGLELNEYVQLYNANELFYLIIDWKLLNPGESFTQTLDPLKQSEVTYFTKENFDLLYNPILSKRIKDSIIPSDLIENISRLADTGLQVISDTDVSWTVGQYGKYDGSVGTSSGWKIMTNPEPVKPNTVYTYYGGLLGSLAGIQILDLSDNVVDFITAPSDSLVKELDFRTVSTAAQIRASYYVHTTNSVFRIVQKDVPTVNRTATKNDLEGSVKFGRIAQIRMIHSDVTWEQGYWDVYGNAQASSSWYRTIIDVIEGTAVHIISKFLGTTAHNVFIDIHGEKIESITYGDLIGTEITAYRAMPPKGAVKLKISHYTTSLNDFVITYDKFIEGESFRRIPKSIYSDLVNHEFAFLFRQINPKYNYKDIINSLPPAFIKGDTYLIGSDFNGYKTGNVIYYDGEKFKEESINLNLQSQKSNSYDVVILGAGAGGLGAAYALKDSGLKVLLIDENERIGGTHINAWINCFAECVPPPFFKELADRGFQRGICKYVDNAYQDYPEGTNISYDMTYLPKRFTKLGNDASIYFDQQGLADMYMADLQGKIDIMLNTKFVEVVNHADRYVHTISILTNGLKQNISSKYFIDSTDGQLIRKINAENGVDYFLGEDANNRYQSLYGFTEPNTGSTNKLELNAPTLMYNVKTGTEDLAKVSEAYTNDGVLYSNQDNSELYINAVHFFNITGYAVIQNGERSTYQTMQSRSIRHWKKIKNGGNTNFTKWHLPNKKYFHFAPKLGVRETYRIACERMLNETNLSKKIGIDGYDPATALDFDKTIAIGSHGVDIHSYTSSVNVTAINTTIRPYRVPFGCIIPKKLNNVLIASKSAGFTHIAAGSFRLNKELMNIGHAAGVSVKQAYEKGLMNIRDINVDEMLEDHGINASINHIFTFLDQ